MHCVAVQRRVRGASLDAEALELSGLEIMEGYRDAQLVGPPIAHLTGLRIDGAAPGSVAATMPARWLQWSRGTVPGPALALLADTPLGAACQTVLPPRHLLATAQIALSFHHPVAADSGTLRADGGGVERLQRNAMRSMVDIRDGTGVLVATGSALMTVRELAGDAAPPGTAVPDAVASDAEADDLPDPYLCPLDVEAVPAGRLAGISGLELLDLLARGQLPPSPLQRLIGVRPTAARSGASTWEMATTPWLCSVVPGEVYGGATAMFAGMAALGAGETLAPAGSEPELRQVTVRRRSRSVPDGRLLIAHGVVLRRDGDAVSTRADVLDARGNVVASATVELMVPEP